MSEHRVTIAWKNAGPDFAAGKYSRAHIWKFDGGVTVPASPSPSVVPAPWSNPANVDPEEAYVAAISSCHMLTYLWLASREGFQIESYEDDSVGIISKNNSGVAWVSRVTLNPRIVYGKKRPSAADETRLHHESHEQCFIANSIKTEVVIGSGNGH